MPLRNAGGEHRHDARMLQSRRERDLAREALGGHVDADVRRERLEHDLTPERVFGGDEDARHPAAAELALDGVDGGDARLGVDRGGQSLRKLRLRGIRVTRVDC